MSLPDLLKMCSAGGAVLFCGAGFSADCLNLAANNEFGASAALLNLLNKDMEKEIPSPYKELRNAADKFIALRGETMLLGLLRDRFNVAHVTDEMIELVCFPWDRIYTTNYDNAIEFACRLAERNFKTLNNLDKPEAVPGGGVEIVHLHGYADKWDIHNFRRSCILGADSYFEADRVLGRWLSKLQEDYDRARLFLFVGFAAGDFHLNRVFYNVREARQKVFFVNRSAASVDPDLQAAQEKFGKLLSIGRAGLANLVREGLEAGKPTEPSAPSYRQYERPTQAIEIPKVEAIRNLFLFGDADRTQLVRDVSLRKSDYHVLRAVTDDIINAMESGNSVILITGEICDGKSLVVEELCARLSLARPVYVMYRPYETIVEETINLISTYRNPTFCIENCFDLSSQRLDNLLHVFTGSRASLVLTSRSISAQAEPFDFERLKAFESLRRFRLSRLNEAEIGEMVRLSDQVAGWAEVPRTHAEKLRFIRVQCRASLPAFLLELLKSQYVRDRYAEEYRKTVELCSPVQMSVIIAALYVTHIGHDAPLPFLSNIFRMDVSEAFSRIGGGGDGLRLVRVENGRLKTVPSIGASAILRELVSRQNSRVIVDTVVEILRALAERTRGDLEQRMFIQLMRYSILSTVVLAVNERNRFFDNVSQIDACRRHALFWLQWHMAMVDQGRFVDAETYLQRSYREAELREKRSGTRYDTFHIDDRRAKFLMIRDRNETFRSNMFYDLRDACQITERLLRRNDVTHHPFETFIEIMEFWDQVGSGFEETLKGVARAMIERVGSVAETRVGLFDEGYPRSRAEQALARFVAFTRNA